MTLSRAPSFLLSSLLVLAMPACGPRTLAAPVEDGHEHDPARVTVFGQRVLLYLEHPRLVRGEPARFLAHVTVLATGEPVRSGALTLEIGSTRLGAEAPKREGLFIPEGACPQAGSFPTRLVVRSEQAEEELDLGPIVVHASASEAERAAQAEEVDEPAGTVAFLLEQQWKVRLLLAEAQSRTLSRRLVLPARVLAPEGRAALVTTPVAGRLEAAPGGVWPRTGESVAAGQTLAFVEPPLGAADLAQLHALELELELKELELLHASGEAETRLRFAERERERLRTLRAEGLGTQPQLELAEQSLALAQAELEAAGRMKTALERLAQERAAASGGAASVRVPLLAPIGGTVVEAPGVVGATLAPGETVLRILDTSRVWVEGRVSEFDLGLLGTNPGGVARLAALPGRTFELAGPGGGAAHVAPEVEASSRSLRVRFELENADGALRPGMLAELFLSTGTQDARVVIPRAAVVSDQGFSTAYVMLAGELFQRRELELGLEDGDWVEVLQGLAPGERVATRGAYIVKLAALSPASFGHGHAH